MKKEVYVLGSKEYFFSVPDNEDSFFAFINLVINNRNNAHIPNGNVEQRPKKVGPVAVTYTHNEVGELFMVTNNHWRSIQTLQDINNKSLSCEAQR